VVALAGGVGGAKLVDGLAAILPAERLTVVVNTGDDFEHCGLRISPDLDTVTYTLAGLASTETGWGRGQETWKVLEELRRLGGPTWFRMGDRDLALHLERTRLLKAGKALSEVVKRLCDAFGVAVRVLPMCDEQVTTVVLTQDGDLPFQEYFVARGCEPVVTGFRYQGIEGAAPAPGTLQALSEADLVVFCPSNPWVSLDPILAVPGTREALAHKTVVGVSPIVGGKALRGPAAKMFTELGIQPSPSAVAQHFRGLLKGFVIDVVDRGEAGAIHREGIAVRVTDTVMKDRRSRARLAQDVLNLGAELLAGEVSS
jgi:LPPG:FO 2-phospho-L-lactate transferase